jgi:hypothetical protein
MLGEDRGHLDRDVAAIPGGRTCAHDGNGVDTAAVRVCSAAPSTGSPGLARKLSATRARRSPSEATVTPPVTDPAGP